MGLDTVELVMAIEEEFGIEIPDKDAATLETVGAIHAYVLKQPETSHLDRNAVWECIKSVVGEVLGVSPDEITRKAHIVRDLRAD